MFSDNLRRSGHQPNTFIRLLLVTVIILLYTVPVTIAAFCYTMASVDKVPTTSEFFSDALFAASFPLLC